MLRGSGTLFPRWMKWAGMGVGLFLLADGMRRFVSGDGISVVFSYLLVSTACIYISGYEKRIFLSEKGFERKTLFWGRGRSEQLSWEEMEEVLLLPSSKGTVAIFPLKEKGWRAFFPGVCESEFREFVARHREDLPVHTGTASNEVS